MIDQLFNLIKQNAGDEIIGNPAIPEQRNEEAVKDVGEEISKGLEHEANQGNVQNLISMFKGNSETGLTGNPMVKSIITNLTAKFASKFGVSPEQANQIAAGLVPKVLNQFINKTNDPNDSEFDLSDILKQVTGNANIGDLMGQFTSGKGGIGESIGGFFGDKK